MSQVKGIACAIRWDFAHFLAARAKVGVTLVWRLYKLHFESNTKCKTVCFFFNVTLLHLNCSPTSGVQFLSRL